MMKYDAYVAIQSYQTVAKAVERRPSMWQKRSFVPGPVKPMTYKIDASYLGAQHEYGSSVSGQCQVMVMVGVGFTIPSGTAL